LLPDLSRAASASDWEGFRARFHDGIRVITFLLLPASVGYLVLARGITRVFLSHGVATVADADAVAVVLQAFAVGLVSFSTFQFLTRCFYAMPDTRTPLALNAVAVGANVAVDLPLFVLFGVRGLAFGHAIAYTLGTLLLLRALSRRIGGLGLRRIAGSSARTAAAAVGMGVAVWVLRETVGGHDAFGVAVAVGTGAMLYLAFSLVMGVEERRTLGLLVGRRRGEPRTRREPGDDTRPDNSE
jgi:putative peptidoglycan lipid II flippase